MRLWFTMSFMKTLKGNLEKSFFGYSFLNVYDIIPCRLKGNLI